MGVFLILIPVDFNNYGYNLAYERNEGRSKY